LGIKGIKQFKIKKSKLKIAFPQMLAGRVKWDIPWKIVFETFFPVILLERLAAVMLLYFYKKSH